MSSMPQTTPEDLEHGNNPDGGPTRPAPNDEQKEPSFGDSSGPFFSIYSKAAEDEDNKMVERWQKDADGILIFTGLFSAAVAALLGVTIQDLRPNSQDTSAFYLGNIYEVLADPNVTRASIPSPVAKPPPFSRPRYAVWVNSLWFLSLVMSLSCALLATSLHQWARRYIRLTQPARRPPEKRARMRAFYADGVDKMHVPWAVEGLPTLLHLSLFLFFGGVVIFLFNVDKEVFTCVACWIGLFVIVYGLITMLPLIRHNSPYYTPLSKPAWYLYFGICHGILSAIMICYVIYVRFLWLGPLSLIERCEKIYWRYRHWISAGMEEAAEETAKEQTSKIDLRILNWTFSDSLLGDDSLLEKFFEAIPGLFDSERLEVVKNNFRYFHFPIFWEALDRFMECSKSVTESVKIRRDNICKDILRVSLPYREPGLDETMRSELVWYLSKTTLSAVSRSLVRTQERDGHWIAAASAFYGVPKDVLEPHVTLGGDNALLAIVIDICHRYPTSNGLNFIEAFNKFDIRDTLPRLQHAFCMLWNELVQEARNSPSFAKSIWILRAIRQLYVSLHQGTDAAPTAFSASTPSYSYILYRPSSYPLCDIASHHPDIQLHAPSGSGTALRQVEQASIAEAAEPSSLSDPMTFRKFRDRSQASAVTEPALLVQTSSNSTDALPPGAAPPEIPSVVVLPHTLQGTVQRDISTAGAPSASDPLPPALSVIGSPTTTFPHPPHILSFPDTESLVLLNNGTTTSRSTCHTTPRRVRARGVVNTGDMCFANVVLQLLVHSPPFWNIFRELDDLKWHPGAGGLESGGSATPLVDSTARFFEEFMFKEELPPAQKPLQQALREPPRQDEGEKEEKNAVDSFEPTYIYEVMKRKRKLEALLDGKHKDAAEFFALYLKALDDELVELHAYISTHKPASAPSVEKLEGDVLQVEGQAGPRNLGHTASSVDSPISRIFGGRSRLTVRVPSWQDAVITEAWLSLQLNIQPNSVHTIQDALAQVSHPQPVKVGQTISEEATRQVLLEALPPILVIHLERFLYDATTNSINKINKPLQFEPELKIPLVDPEIIAPIAGKSADPVHYKLHGVLYHHGESASSAGHYTVNVLHQNENNSSGESWLHIDDEAVSSVRHEDVFGGHDNERVDVGCAYMLFYCRTASSSPAPTR